MHQSAFFTHSRDINQSWMCLPQHRELISARGECLIRAQMIALKMLQIGCFLTFLPPANPIIFWRPHKPLFFSPLSRGGCKKLSEQNACHGKESSSISSQRAKPLLHCISKQEWSGGRDRRMQKISEKKGSRKRRFTHQSSLSDE